MKIISVRIKAGDLRPGDVYMGEEPNSRMSRMGGASAMAHVKGETPFDGDAPDVPIHKLIAPLDDDQQLALMTVRLRHPGWARGRNGYFAADNIWVTGRHDAPMPISGPVGYVNVDQVEIDIRARTSGSVPPASIALSADDAERLARAILIQVEVARGREIVAE